MRHHFLWLVATAGAAVANQGHAVHKRLHAAASVSGTGSGSGPYGNATSTLSPFVPQPTAVCAYWLEDSKHQGVAAFNPDPATYEVFRNVKDYGAQGDGITDDTAAINRAISSGNRCGPGTCNSTTTTPAIVYFPQGRYIVSAPIIDYYYTQLIGNPNCVPTIKTAANFTGAFVIDGDQYGAAGTLEFGATNVFWRQIRNFVMDLTSLPLNLTTTAIHWPTGQATSLQFMTILMSEAAGNQQSGVLIESGSGGFVGDLAFYGGLTGITMANQQFTWRNISFYNAVTAISQKFDWGWLYSQVHIQNCSVGINMTGGGVTDDAVGSVVMIDSSICDTPLGIVTSYDATSQPPTAGSLILENVRLDNVPVAVQGPGNVTALAGTTGTTTITAWGEGHEYTPKGPTTFQGPITPNTRPGSLVSGADYYSRSKPQYEKYALDSFLSARTLGATGDGRTDDTVALQNAINSAVQQDKILFVDHGDYLVTNTIAIPAGAKIVGESYSVILSSGDYFANIYNPQPILRVGTAGETGSIEMQDIIVSTKGAQAGAVLIEHNLASPAGTPSGYWDTHARIGGFAGSNLQLADCPTTANISTPPAHVNSDCIAAYLNFHITAAASGVYLENVWLWVADHDVEDPLETQITVYAGRGLLDSSNGPVWLVGTAVEHHVKYQYQFAHATDVFAGFIQTETAYYQPNPPAGIPFPYVAALYDPQFPNGTQPVNTTISNSTIPGPDGWGLRIVDSSDILVYGAGHYSFFDNYNVTCSNEYNGEVCQERIVQVKDSVGVSVYGLNTVGTHYMLTVDGTDEAFYEENFDGFVDTIALFRTGS